MDYNFTAKVEQEFDRIAEGKKPACVHHCLAKCMEAVPLEDVPARMAELGAGVTCFMPQ